MSYSHYTLEERKCLQQLRDEGWGIRQIARATGRAPSTVSRELKRNRSKKGYGFWYAKGNRPLYQSWGAEPRENCETCTRFHSFLFAFWGKNWRLPLNRDSIKIADGRFTHRICTKPVEKEAENPCGAGVFRLLAYAQNLHKMR